MFTFGLLYIIFYILILLSLFLLLFLFIPLNILTAWSLTSYLVFIQKYTNMKGLFFFLIFALTGLPPVGLFFVKFNILAFLLYQTNPGFMFILFLVFFLNMLYYIQLFNIKNFKHKVYHQITPVVLRQWAFDSKFANASRLNYHFLYSIITVLFFISLSIFLYVDLFLFIKS